MNARFSKLLHDMTYAMVEYIGETIDVCETKGYERGGIGYNELRWIEIEDCCLIMESNSVNECNSDGEIEGLFHKFQWNEISDSDKMDVYRFIGKLVEKKINEKD